VQLDLPNQLGLKLNGTESYNIQKMVYLGLGSNIDPSKNIVRAVKELKKSFNVIKVSSIWESAPVGSHGPIFLNGAAAISTADTLGMLKTKLREIEKRLGRIRTLDKNAPRTIDLDILIYGGKIMDTDIWTLPYLAIPLADVYPLLVNPKSGQTIKYLSDRLKKMNDIYHREDLLKLI
jgi:2-amino-4-hydroxy-6-hydroxymethyldihydropteridine diphosphokinase